MIVALDVDDTLYRELDYVESGFHVVAGAVAKDYPISSESAFEVLMQSMNDHGRGRQFDDLLRTVEAFSVARRDALVQLYRQHTPAITLPAESRQVLETLRADGHRLFLVTDGNHHVQNRKVEALGLREYVEHAYLTGRYGRAASKPSTLVFELMLRRTGADPNELVYVGDNPRKDFVGVRQLGGRTIRVLTGAYRGETAEPGYDADLTVETSVSVPETLSRLTE